MWHWLRETSRPEAFPILLGQSVFRARHQQFIDLSYHHRKRELMWKVDVIRHVSRAIFMILRCSQIRCPPSYSQISCLVLQPVLYRNQLAPIEMSKSNLLPITVTIAYHRFLSFWVDSTGPGSLVKWAVLSEEGTSKQWPKAPNWSNIIDPNLSLFREVLLIGTVIKVDYNYNLRSYWLVSRVDEIKYFWNTKWPTSRTTTSSQVFDA